MHGKFFALDVNSGAVLELDKLTYDILACFDSKPPKMMPDDLIVIDIDILHDQRLAGNTGFGYPLWRAVVRMRHLSDLSDRFGVPQIHQKRSPCAKYARVSQTAGRETQGNPT